MIFTETHLTGVFEMRLQMFEDDRGFFARTWCEKEFAERGLSNKIVQMNSSFNFKEGTLRGMHYQAPPHAEVKLVRVISGAIWDVALDLRPDSPTYLKWHGVELSAANRAALYIPEGFAHGYQTLAENTEVLYAVSAPYFPEAARGVRYNDPAFGIEWPLPVSSITDRDRDYPNYAATPETV